MRIMLLSILCALILSSPVMADDSSDNKFCDLDKNQDSCLTRQEFVEGTLTIDRQKAVNLFPGIGDSERMNDRALKEALFDRMDKNHDGLLSKDEWRQVAPNILEIRF